MVEGHHLWWRVIIHGEGLSFVDRGGRLWSSGCVGSLSVWGVVIHRGSLSSECGMWLSVGGSLSSVCGAGLSIDGESLSMGTGLSSSVDHHVPWMVVGC